MDNTITNVGNLTRGPSSATRPPASRTTPSASPSTGVWTDRQTNESKEQVSFFDLVCWRERADKACETLTKGAMVILTVLEQRSWEDNDGKRRSKVEIVADDVGPSPHSATAEVAKHNRPGDPRTAVASSAGPSDPALQRLPGSHRSPLDA